MKSMKTNMSVPSLLMPLALVLAFGEMQTDVNAQCYVDATRICHTGTPAGTWEGTEMVACGQVWVLDASGGHWEQQQQNCQYKTSDGLIESYASASNGLDNTGFSLSAACHWTKTYASTCCGGNVVGPFNLKRGSYRTYPKGNTCPAPSA